MNDSTGSCVTITKIRLTSSSHVAPDRVDQHVSTSVMDLRPMSDAPGNSEECRSE
jgi:hypothetical protein